MRVLAVAVTMALAGCSAEQVVTQLTNEGWTEHRFAGTEREWMRYLCDPRDLMPDPRAAEAHRRLDQGIIEISERAADDVIEGRINAIQFGLRIEREVSQLASEIEADTGCVLIDSSET